MFVNRRSTDKLLIKSEIKEYGIKSFIYGNRKPFDPNKLNSLILSKSINNGIYRGKGFIWLATRNDTMFDWNMAGNIIDINYSNNWFASVNEKDWNIYDESIINNIKKDFDGEYGDRRQEIVFIGNENKMNEKYICEQLDLCLITDIEFYKGPKFWKLDLIDPFEFDYEEDNDSEEDSEEESYENDSEEESDNDSQVSDID